MYNLFCFPQHTNNETEYTPLLDEEEVVIDQLRIETTPNAWKYPIANQFNLQSLKTDKDFKEFINMMATKKGKYQLKNLRLDCLDNTIVVPLLNDAKWVQSIGIKNFSEMWFSEEFRTYILCQGYQFLNRINTYTLELNSDLDNEMLNLFKELIEICYNLSTLTLIPLKSSSTKDFDTCYKCAQRLKAYNFEVYNLKTLNIGSYDYPIGEHHKLALIHFLKVFNFSQLRNLSIINVELTVEQLQILLSSAPGVTHLQSCTNLKFNEVVECLAQDYLVTKRQLKTFEFYCSKGGSEPLLDNITDFKNVFSNLEAFHISGNNNQLVEVLSELVNPNLKSLCVDYMLYNDGEVPWVDYLHRFKNLERLSIHIRFGKYVKKTPESLAIAIRSMQICDGIKELGVLGNFNHYELSKALVLISQTVDINTVYLTNIPEKIVTALKENKAIGEYKILSYPQKRRGAPIGYEFW